MAVWQRTKHVDLTELNNGEQFTTNTRITYSMLNDIIHELIFQYERLSGHIVTSIYDVNNGGDDNG